MTTGLGISPYPPDCRRFSRLAAKPIGLMGGGRNRSAAGAALGFLGEVSGPVVAEVIEPRVVRRRLSPPA